MLTLICERLLTSGEAVGLNVSQIDQHGRAIAVRKRRSGVTVRTELNDSPFWQLYERYLANCPFKSVGDGPAFFHFDATRMPVHKVSGTIAKLRRTLGLGEAVTAKSGIASNFLAARERGFLDNEVLEMTGWANSDRFSAIARQAPANGDLIRTALARMRDRMSPEIPGAPIDMATLVGQGPAKLPPDCGPARAPLAQQTRLFVDPDIRGHVEVEPNSNYRAWLLDFETYLARNRISARDADPVVIEWYLRFRLHATVQPNTLYCVGSCLRSFYRAMISSAKIARDPMLRINIDRTYASKPPTAASADLIRIWIARLEEGICNRQRSRALVNAAALVALCALEGQTCGQIIDLRSSTALDRFGAASDAAQYIQLAVGRLALLSRPGGYLFQGYDPKEPMARQHLALMLRTAADELDLPRVNMRQLSAGFRSAFLRELADVHLLAVATGSEVVALRYEYSELGAEVLSSSEPDRQLRLDLR
jgi:site-specific recombinase XerD